MSEKIVQLKEEAIIEMYLTGASVRRVEDITEALWSSKVSAATVSELSKKAYGFDRAMSLSKAIYRT